MIYFLYTCSFLFVLFPSRNRRAIRCWAIWGYHKKKAKERKKPPRIRRSRPALFRLLLLRLLDLRNSRKPVHPHGCEDVKDNKDPHQSKVAPPQAEIRVQGLQERVGVPHRTEVAIGRCVLVEQIASCHGDIRFHVLNAGLTGGRVEVQVFDRVADDF